MNKKVNGKQKGIASTINMSPKPGTSGLQTIYLLVSDSELPGTSGLQTIYLLVSDSEFEDSLYDHESQMSQSELCCVCKKIILKKLKECGDLTIAKWG